MGDLLGSEIGHLRIVEALGRGGMGEVWAAHDLRLDRRVAVKVIRPDRRLDEEAKLRFLREARTLSKLDHPNICRIHDYVDRDEGDLLVLELLQGTTLKQRLRQSPLRLAEVLRIAEGVASALAVAHAANVVHRDLKPDNVMLTSDGGVKVLDFGLARSLDSELAPTLELRAPSGEPAADPERTQVGGRATGDGASASHTSAGTLLGTIAYMSPEQAQGRPCTAASDMYAFGLLLREMLSGRPPIDPSLPMPEQLRRAAEGEVAPLPGGDRDLAALALRLTAMAPEARPAAADVLERLRWIHARPRRRARRLAAAAAVVLVLLAATKYTLDLRRERNAALAAQQAEARARTDAEQIADFLTGLFAVAAPGQSLGETITARELLDRGAARVRQELADQPHNRARLLLTIGQVYRQLGLFEDAAGPVEEAVALFRAEEGGEENLAKALNTLGSLHAQLGRYDAAEPLYREALALQQQPGDGRLVRDEYLNNLAIVLQRLGRPEEAEPLLLQVMDLQEQIVGPDDPKVAGTLVNLGSLYSRLGRMEEAASTYERAVSIRRQALPPGHPDLSRALSSLAAAYVDLGRSEVAEALYREALAGRERVLGPDHPELAATLNNLASLHLERDEHLAAIPLLERALTILEASRGPSHPEVAIGLFNLGEAYRHTGRTAEAEPALQRALAIFEVRMGQDSPYVAYPLHGLANLYRDTGRASQAQPLYQRALAIRRAALPPDDEDLVELEADLARLGATSAG